MLKILGMMRWLFAIVGLAGIFWMMYVFYGGIDIQNMPKTTRGIRVIFLVVGPLVVLVAFTVLIMMVDWICSLCIKNFKKGGSKK